ncbi:hypothetical protein Namu_3677 [Nakamurella multipartita DSM 44233]|uniref:Uncharacterized protein n=1 Tax=Nakamurella multipartita (strain ATCC 700099 / DSM 44233 / CIP 104796 / JCM 9543 / NBRC 105858 / Y-104) TaxID=479431 RepID=C8XFL2_NAKMY|nr:hypothetical protein Namu_3677 [Nakamurella multipartita DSM 44233]
MSVPLYDPRVGSPDQRDVAGRYGAWNDEAI